MADGYPGPLGQLGVNVIAPEAPAGSATTTTAAVVSSDLMQRFVTQFGSLMTTTPAAAAPLPAQGVVPVVSAPLRRPEIQVTLNQVLRGNKVVWSRPRRS